MDEVFITISDTTFALIEERIKKIKRLFGEKQSNITSTDAFIETLLLKYIRDKDKEDNDTSDNSGTNWVTFRRENFTTIYHASNGKCFYCDKHLTRATATIDHKYAPIRGGQNTLINCALSCAWCNQDKGILTPDEYSYKQLTNKAKGINPPR